MHISPKLDLSFPTKESIVQTEVQETRHIWPRQEVPPRRYDKLSSPMSRELPLSPTLLSKRLQPP